MKSRNIEHLKSLIQPCIPDDKNTYANQLVRMYEEEGEIKHAPIIDRELIVTKIFCDNISYLHSRRKNLYFELDNEKYQLVKKIEAARKTKTIDKNKFEVNSQHEIIYLGDIKKEQLRPLDEKELSTIHVPTCSQPYRGKRKIDLDNNNNLLKIEFTNTANQKQIKRQKNKKNSQPSMPIEKNEQPSKVQNTNLKNLSIIELQTQANNKLSNSQFSLFNSSINTPITKVNNEFPHLDEIYNLWISKKI